MFLILYNRIFNVSKTPSTSNELIFQHKCLFLRFYVLKKNLIGSTVTHYSSVTTLKKKTKPFKHRVSNMKGYTI